MVLGWSGGQGSPSGRSESPRGGVGNLTWEVEGKRGWKCHPTQTLPAPGTGSPVGGWVGLEGAEVRQERPSSVTGTGGSEGCDTGDTEDVTRLSRASGAASALGGSSTRSL